MSKDWYAYSPQGDPMGAGDTGSLQRVTRIQGDFTADSGTLYGLKVKGSLDLDTGGTLTAAPSYPPTGQRATFDATGIALYNSTPAQTVGLNTNDGSAFFGIGATQVTISSAGVVSIPVASIGSLTIANIGTGIMGGTYKSANSGARIELSTLGVKLFDSGGNNTIFLDASAGSLTITGTFTLKSAASGARLELTSTGARWYDAGGNERANILNDGSGALGKGTNTAVSWGTNGNATINASQITAGTISFGGTGTFNTTGSVTGTIGNSGGTLNLGQLTVTGTITLGSGGKIIDADGSYWDQSGIVLISSGTPGDSIKWKNGSTDIGSIYSTASTFYAAYGSAAAGNGYWLLTSTRAELGCFSGYNISIDSSVVQVNGPLQVSGTYDIQMGSGARMLLNYPTSSRHISDNGTDMVMTTNTLRITGSGSYAGLRFDNIANGGSASSWSSFGTANIPDKSAGYVKINIGGTNYRVPFYADS